MPKTAFITGANKGIGFEVARQVGKTGITILLGARNKALGEEAAAKLTAEGITTHFIAIDIADKASITAAAETITNKFGALDILVNNAGIFDHEDNHPTLANLDAVERTWRTNFLGAVAVTQALLPLLLKSPSPRIVNVSSGLGSITQNSDPEYQKWTPNFLGYSASKAALNMFTAQLAYELRDTPIKINSSDPGYTATDLNAHRGTQTIPEGSAETIRLALLPDDGPTGTYSDNKGIVPW
jgi:NAD(P)-dependent dehydrogenase (short-subunit alcohol dehydrogenase family)